MEQKILFWDFEVKKDWWCVTFAERKYSPDGSWELEYYTFEQNDELSLRDFVIKHMSDYIFVGYNNVWFDNWCLKCVWYNVNPYKIVYHCIDQGGLPWELPELDFKRNIPIKSFDLMVVLGGMKLAPPLKEIEANMGIEIIMDETIDNNQWQNLTREQKDKIIVYNKQDVFATSMLFDFLRGDMDSVLLLIKKFNLDWKVLEKPKAQTLQWICKYDIRRQLNPYSFKYKAPSFIKLYDDSIKQRMEEFEFTEDNDFDEEINWNGFKYSIGRGGAHYAIKNYIQDLNDDHILICNDFDSFYPNMMANRKNPELRYLDPVIPYQRYADLVDLRVLSKKEGNTSLAEALKIPCNGAYGKLKDKKSPIRFWPSALSICLTGQLITLMICQELQHLGIGKLIQVNTDGFYYEVKKSELELFNKTMSELEQKIGISFSRDIIKKGKICQKDVSNYVLYNEETGKIKAKGEWVKRYKTNKTYMSYSTAIIDEAIVNQLIFNIPIEKTILDSYTKNEAKKFQIVYNMRGKNWEGCYLCWYGEDKDGDPILQKTQKIQRINRGFASADKSLPELRQLKFPTYHKFDERPSHVYLYNKDLKDLDIRKINLDIQYYIDLAKKGYRLFIGGKK